MPDSDFLQSVPGQDTPIASQVSIFLVSPFPNFCELQKLGIPIFAKIGTILASRKNQENWDSQF
jgi:hypothetical protein